MFSTNCNCCDGKYNSFDVHFTKACDNNCKYCIDKKYQGINCSKPDVKAIAKTIIDNQAYIDDVLFLGGEPCLYLEELIECILLIKRKTALKVFVTSSVPKICYDEKELFDILLGIVDGFNISAQHYNETIADKIRNTKSMYDRQEFYNSLPYKEKIRINLNIVKPYLCTRDDLIKCLVHYDRMEFNSIKLTEIQHNTEYFASFEDIFGIKLESPFSYGCQTRLNEKMLCELFNVSEFKTPLLLKRSCFICEKTRKATLMDGLKAIYSIFTMPKNKYGIVYEDGTMTKEWI